MEWIDIQKQSPKQGEQVLFFNENWKRYNNTKGIRIGFLNGRNMCVTAYQWGQESHYLTISMPELNIIPAKDIESIKSTTQPTHWMPLPEFKLT